MRTYLFSDEDVRRYARDLATRLIDLGDDFPALWFPLGESGDKIAEVLYELVEPEARKQTISIEPIYYSRSDKAVLLRDGGRLSNYGQYRSVLVLDGAVHSGTSMLQAVQRITNNGAQEVLSYSFVVKRTSIFIPNYFGILVDEHDRPYFQLDVIPNNILQDEAPFGFLRRVCAEDANRTVPFLKTGVSSIDRTSFGDLWYADQTEGSHVFVYECRDCIAGFVSFRIEETVMYIELIATDEKFRGKNIGGLLMRWAGTYARSCCCTGISLRSHVERISFYERYGFTQAGRADPIVIGKDLSGNPEAYILMRKPIIYTGNPMKLKDV